MNVQSVCIIVLILEIYRLYDFKVNLLTLIQGKVLLIYAFHYLLIIIVTPNFVFIISLRARESEKLLLLFQLKNIIGSFSVHLVKCSIISLKISCVKNQEMLFVSQRKKLLIQILFQYDICKGYCPEFTTNGYAKLSKFITLNKNCGKMYFDETFHLVGNGGFTQLT